MLRSKSSSRTKTNPNKAQGSRTQRAAPSPSSHLTHVHSHAAPISSISVPPSSTTFGRSIASAQSRQSRQPRGYRNSSLQKTTFTHLSSSYADGDSLHHHFNSSSVVNIRTHDTRMVNAVHGDKQALRHTPIVDTVFDSIEDMKSRDSPQLVMMHSHPPKQNMIRNQFESRQEQQQHYSPHLQNSPSNKYQSALQNLPKVPIEMSTHIASLPWTTPSATRLTMDQHTFSPLALLSVHHIDQVQGMLRRLSEAMDKVNFRIARNNALPILACGRQHNDPYSNVHRHFEKDPEKEPEAHFRREREEHEKKQQEWDSKRDEEERRRQHQGPRDDPTQKARPGGGDPGGPGGPGDDGGGGGGGGGGGDDNHYGPKPPPEYPPFISPYGRELTLREKFLKFIKKHPRVFRLDYLVLLMAFSAYTYLPGIFQIVMLSFIIPAFPGRF